MALWSLLEQKAITPAQSADATARSLAAGPRAGTATGAVMAADNVKAVVEGHYKRVLWVWRCVDAIAQAECSLPIYAWTSHDDDATRADGYDIIEGLLNGPDRPNPGEEYWQLRYRISTLLLLSYRGVFVEIVRDKITGDPAMLSILDPDAVEIIPDVGKKVKAYRVRYATPNGHIEQKELPPESVLWFRGRPHPQDPYAQTTPLVAAGLSADTDYLARVFNANWLRNDGRVSQLIALKADNGMNPTDVDQIKQMFGGGVGRAGETRVVEADQISVAQVGGAPADAQYNNMLNGTKQDIMEAFGISETFISWAQGRTWDNAGVELYATWSGTMRWHCKGFASGFMPLIRGEGQASNGGDTTVLAHDFAKVPELQKPANDKADRAQASWTSGTATLDEVRIAQGRKPFGVPLAQVVWTTAGPIGPDQKTQAAAQELVASMRPAPAAPPGMEGDPAAEPLPAAGGGGGAAQPAGPSAADVQNLAQAVQSAMNARAAELTALPPGQKALVAARGRLAASPERKTGQPRARRTRRIRPRPDDVDGEIVREEVESPGETAIKDAEAAIGRELAAVCRRMLGAVDGRLSAVKTRKGTRHWDPSPAEVKAGYQPSRQLAEFHVAQVERWAHAELEQVRALIRSAASGAMQDLNQTLRLQAQPLMTASRLVRDLVNRLTASVETGMGKRVRAIQQVIRSMDRAGRSIEEIKQAVAEQQSKLDDWVASVAPRVAQAATQGARKIMIDRVPDSEGKAVWRTRGDHRVRDTHVEVDGQVAKRGAGWLVGGYRMAFPGDPRVPPYLWANCRCVVEYHRADGTVH